MKANQALRAVGVAAIVVTFAIYSAHKAEIDAYPLLLAFVFILALISPEALNDLPFGPSK